MEFYLEYVRGGSVGQYERFKDLEIVRVGRNPDGELCLDDLGVSFDHSEVRLRGGAWWVVDRGSTNGTYVNGERAHNKKLREGDIVRFGKRGPEMRYRLRPPANSSQAPPREPEAGRVHVVSGDGESRPASSASGSRRRPTSRIAEVDPIEVVASPKAAARPASRGLVMVLAGALVVCVGVLAFLATQSLNAEDTMVRQRLQITGLQTDLTSSREELESAKTRLTERERELVTERERMASLRIDLQRLKERYNRESQRWEELQESFLQQIRDRERQLEEARAKARQAAPTGGFVSDRQRFQDIQERYNESVVFIFTQLKGTKPDGEAVSLNCTGTGFIVTRQGHVVTNKHVLYPWKFSQMARRIAEEEITIDPESHHIAVWLAGRRFMDRSRRTLELRTGYSTQTGSLRRFAMAEDVWATMRLGEGEAPRELKVHNPKSDNDIAILKIDSGDEFKPVIPFGMNDLPIRKLDPVMVLGFPLGASILESEVAETSPNMGTVRKVESSIWIDGSMHPGNSGGPVFNSHGRVIGISTRIIGSENVGACIKIEHALKLLGGTW